MRSAPADRLLGRSQGRARLRREQVHEEAGLLAQRMLGEPSPAGRAGKALLDGVELASAARIELVGPSAHTTLVSRPDGWVVQEQGAFPANPGKLNDLLVKLAGEKIADKVTENPDDFADLGVRTVEENGNKAEERKTGTLFRILDGAGKPVFQLLIGRDRQPGTTASSYGGQYVRFPQDKAALLIGETLFAETEPKEWIEKQILPREAEGKFKLIRVERTGARPLAFSRDKPEGPWQLDGTTPAGLNAKEVDNLSKKLRDLEASQIAPAGKSRKELGREKLSAVEVQLFDGRAFRLEVGNAKGQDGLRYVTVRETLDPSKTDAALNKEVEAFNGKFKDRVLAIPDWDATRLLRERKEYMQAA